MMRGIMKRKFSEVDGNPCYSSSSPLSSSSPTSSEWESDGEPSSADNHDLTPHSLPSPSRLPLQSILKKDKIRGAPFNVRFEGVTVFSFPRCQGFTSVPRCGGATLGMGWRHGTMQSYTLAEHALEKQRRRRERVREKQREERLKALKHKPTTGGAMDQQEAEKILVDQTIVEDCDIHLSEAEVKGLDFLRPYSSKQRQVLLQEAGVKRIDRDEKRQLHVLRLSREACGCDCQGFCEPETCSCSLAGIKCQVDNSNFPCGCTTEACANTHGVMEFNSKRVQTHYIHTVMRLELERQRQGETLSQDDQAGLPEDLAEYGDPDEAHVERSAQDKSCPFEFTMEESGLSLTLPATASLHLVPGQLGLEENSCSSMTESSSSDSDAGGCLAETQSLHEGLPPCHLSKSGYENNTMCTADNTESLTGSTFTNNASMMSLTDENANQARYFLDHDSLEDFPHNPSPTADCSAGRYVDLSLSSDSDLEFFDSDYPSAQLQSSFKRHRLSENVCHLQLYSSVNLPQYESSTYLLESLIGLTEQSPEQVYPITENLFL